MTINVTVCETLQDAARALANERNACFMGGGTLVMRALNAGSLPYETLVRTTDPAFRRIELRGDRTTLGAGVTMAQLIASRELDFLAPVARAIGGPAVRTTATVGGNLFAYGAYGDLACALLVLDAVVTVAGAAGSTDLPIERFLASLGPPGEHPHSQRPPLVASITVARPPRDAFRFHKVTRVKPAGVALMSLAACLPMRGASLAGARFAYGAMTPRAMRVPAVEQALEGRPLTEAGIEPALRQCLQGFTPRTDAIASAWYRGEVAPVHLKRLLLGC